MTSKSAPPRSRRTVRSWLAWVMRTKSEARAGSSESGRRRRVAKSAAQGPQGMGECGRFSPDGKLLASGGFSIRQGARIGGGDVGSPDLGDSIRLWDVATWKDIRQFPGEPGGNPNDSRMVNALAFTPSGRTLISGEENGSIVLYDVSNASVRATLRGHQSGARALGVSSDGRRLVSASMDLTGLIWDLPAALERGIAH